MVESTKHTQRPHIERACARTHFTKANLCKEDDDKEKTTHTHITLITMRKQLTSRLCLIPVWRNKIRYY